MVRPEPNPPEAIIERLRDRSHLEDCGEHGLERVVYIEQAEAAIYEAAATEGDTE